MADYPDHLVDKRIVDRNIAKGLISRTDYERHLEGLKDAGDNAEVVRTEDTSRSSHPSGQETNGAGSVSST